METIGECVGGCADGVQLDPDDPDEPDDWPEVIVIECKKTRHVGFYRLRSGKPKTVSGKRIFYFDAIT